MTVMDRFNDPINKNIMEAKELRIGNYVDYLGQNSIITDIVRDHGRYFIDTDKFRVIFLDSIDLNPIPLTEEWLKKCGFDNSEYKKGYIGIDVRYTDFVLAYPKTHIEHSEFFCWTFEQGKLQMFKEIKYVHQLQNLYFALTGEELTIKEL